MNHVAKILLAGHKFCRGIAGQLFVEFAIENRGEKLVKTESIHSAGNIIYQGRHLFRGGMGLRGSFFNALFQLVFGPLQDLVGALAGCQNENSSTERQE